MMSITKKIGFILVLILGITSQVLSQNASELKSDSVLDLVTQAKAEIQVDGQILKVKVPNETFRRHVRKIPRSSSGSSSITLTEKTPIPASIIQKYGLSANAVFVTGTVPIYEGAAFTLIELSFTN
ncbi:MAG: hypothetical protein KDE26_24885 [Bacteroidetes bacterium]|nr:hypothetical protein [Bacteroidota bacterium]MCB0846518.1 hypothetical protein [Bacteroidota bacterium]